MRKLTLNTETLRHLTDDEAQHVNGGKGAPCTAINSFVNPGTICTAPNSVAYHPKPKPQICTAINSVAGPAVC